MTALETLKSNFSITNLQAFFRNISSFNKVSDDFDHLFNDATFDKYESISKFGQATIENDEIVFIASRTNDPLTERSGKKKQYEIAKRILKNENADYSIFVFYDDNGNFRISLISRIYKTEKLNRVDYSNYKRQSFYVTKDKSNKTFINQFKSYTSESPIKKINQLEKIFSLEEVSNTFYNEFTPRFTTIVESIDKSIDINTRQDFALLFIIRTIFIGFVQKKGWIGKKESFVLDFWNEYKTKSYKKNEFYTRWYKPFLFEALNSAYGHKVAYQNNEFSKEVEDILQLSPYLNGELFKEKAGIDTLGINLSDETIDTFFEFLFAYNFTVEESSPLDEDLELNPEFLGIIFEKLVNKEDGAVYTPRTEVDFMCRISLLKWLEKVTEINKNDLTNLLFRNKGTSKDDKENQKQGDFSAAEIKLLIEKLKSVSICDPASGSGAFPVGMLQVLNDILGNLQSRNNCPEELKNERSFERKKAIIASSLYGVEVKQWAVWINQLRLWLSLFVDIPKDREQEFITSTKPLLPNLSFKIRRGDALVQRIGTKSFPIDSQADVSLNVKRKITELKKLKNDFFYNQAIDYGTVRAKENQIFEEILKDQIDEKLLQIKKYNQTSLDLDSQQLLFGEIKPKQVKLSLYEAEIAQLEEEIENLREEKKSLKEEHPLIWNIEFSEVFYDKGGFDIIIGNPPYLRQEDIADPLKYVPNAKDYKELLVQSIYENYPKYFKKGTKLVYKINGKSDLFTFFYLKSLKLLNKEGIQTFICSNSWLDVDYGAWMQEFLIKNCKVHYIIDNQSQRSFSNADINTIISVLEAPKPINKLNDVTAKFVMFKKSFDETLVAENILLIDNQNKTVEVNNDFRCYQLKNGELLEEGNEYENETQKKLKQGKYIGDKWGGKYLKAPDIFFTIIEKGKEKLVKLKDIAEVKFGIKTGCNEFFYLTSAQAESLKIEKEFLKPIFKSPKDSKSILMENFSLLGFWCHKTKDELKNTNALKYIEWGENYEVIVKQGTEIGKKIIGFNNISSVKSRKQWYSLPNDFGAKLFVQMTFNDVFKFFKTKEISLADARLYEIKSEIENLGDYLNTTLSVLFLELFGRGNLGEGALDFKVYEAENIRLIDPNKFELKLNKNDFDTREQKSIFVECGIDPYSEILISEQEPNPLTDRKAIDDIVFDTLDLTNDERKEVYRAVCQLVWNRISKAKSLN